MGGITGWVRFTEPGVRATVVEAMTATLHRRGPDGGGVWSDRHAAIGHRRLAVLDLADGAQPMTSARHGREVVLSYCGAVYNHDALRARLRELGHEFRTRGDTEVVLHGYLEWGAAVAERLEGMYAFAVWDTSTERLLLVRDRLGVKPLYVAEVTGGLTFGSEPKALFAHPEISPRIDADGLREAYGLPFNTGPTLWSGVREVPPGVVLTLDRDGLTERRYWTLEVTAHTDDLEETIRRVAELVGEAARGQLEADVARSMLLSGGLDSSVLTALIADELRSRDGAGATIPTYTAGYPEPGGDTQFADEAGRFIGTDHHTVTLDPRSLLDLDNRRAVVASRDSPIGVGDRDTSLYLLFGEISQWATVAVSGEAADEAFAGYSWFHDPHLVATNRFPWLLPTGDDAMPIHPDLAKTLRITEFQEDSYNDALARVPHLEREHLLEYRQRQLRYLVLTRWLRQLLHRTDRLSMAHGLQVRLPYCDHRLVEYAFNIPWSIQSHDGREKSVLRAVAAGIVPDSVRRRPKNSYPSTRHPDYVRGLQHLARQSLDVGAVRAIADESSIETTLEVPPESLRWVQRLRLERVVDLALTLDEYQPELAF